MNKLSSEDKVIVILGPTAVGKTDISLSLASKLDTEIVSGDSMLVYKGLDIGTAKPSDAELRSVKHHLIDVLEPDESYNVTDFQEQAGALIHRLNRQGKIPLLVGGTSLYIKALLEGYDFNVTAGQPSFRSEMHDMAKTYGKKHVHHLLEQIDPVTASRIHENNLVRVIRALEVKKFSGERISDKSCKRGGRLVCKAFVAGLMRSRERIYERINQRVEGMIELGLFDEVRKLFGRGFRHDTPAMKGIGYSETIRLLEQGLPLESAKPAIQLHTRHFAKRQLTWFLKMPYICWYDLDTMSHDTAVGNILDDALSFFETRIG